MKYIKYKLFKGRGPATQFPTGVTNLGQGPVGEWYYGTANVDTLPDLTDFDGEEITEEQYKNDLMSTVGAKLARLVQIDAESVRPLRAIAENTAEQFDIDKLAALEAEAVALRAQL